MKKEFLICVLAYGKLYDMARRVAAELDYEDTEILICDCNVDTLAGKVEQAAAQGCEVFVAGAGNAAEFSRCSQAHLVEIRMGTVEYLRAIRKAAEIGSHPAIAAYRYSRPVDLDLLEELSGVRLELIQYEDSAELYHGISNSSADVVIGASHAVEIAGELQKKSVLLYFSEDTVRSALRRARLLTRDLQKNVRSTCIQQAIINHTPFGMAVTDEQGKIVILNQAIRRQIGYEGARVQGRLLSELVPSLAVEDFLRSEARQTDQRRLINGVMLRCIQTRIENQNVPIGVLTVLYPDNARRSRAEAAEAVSYKARHQWKSAIGSSPALQQAIRSARRYADLPNPLMIDGEDGVGKNFFSQCIHNGSLRAGAPYISVNLSAIPDQEVSRVLFGTEEGSFVRPGLFELAQDGTLVLQELGTSTPVVQGCVLQVLADRQFRRLGGIGAVPLRARLISVCGKDDHAHIREDLWQRLSVFHLEIPPLRMRKEDILPLFTVLAQENSRGFRKPGTDFEDLLRFYSWPGNLPELSSVCTRYLYLLSRTEKPSAGARMNFLIQAIGEDALFEEFLRLYPFLRNPSEAAPEDVFRAVEHIKHLLKYNNDRLAEKLSLSRTTLWRIKKAAEEKG